MGIKRDSSIPDWQPDVLSRASADLKKFVCSPGGRMVLMILTDEFRREAVEVRRCLTPPDVEKYLHEALAAAARMEVLEDLMALFSSEDDPNWLDEKITRRIEEFKAHG